jgi:hypothetical protein
MRTRKSSFYPFADLTDKQNYKEYKIVERDGSTLERIFLNIPIPSLREKIICFHYLSRRVKLFETDDIGCNIMSRDDPWDFKVDFSSGEIFNVEITSIAESAKIFEMLKREERLLLARRKERIALHELEKLNYFFPDKNVKKLIDSLKNAKKSKTDLVENPIMDKTFVTIGEINEQQPNLAELIEQAIHRKELKKHCEKEKTVLLIDNRTFRYEISDLQVARKKLEDYFQRTAFMEIWFYTGYYSSFDGNDAEYNLAPLKLTHGQESILSNYVQEKPPNEDGIILLKL